MRTAAIIVSVFMFSGWGFATTYHVPSQVPTIQQAIDLAHHGDNIIVAPGTYWYSIDFKGKAVTLKSSHGPEVTVIKHRIIFSNKEGPNSEVDGFTIDSRLEAVYCHYDTAPTIRNNIIRIPSYLTNNSIGIYVRSGAAPSILNNRFDNRERDWIWFDQFGDSIHCESRSSPRIEGNYFSGGLSAGGGAIYCGEESSPVIRKNTFFRCWAALYDGLGGAIYCDGCSSLIEGNSFLLCRAYGSEDICGGGALYCYRSTCIIRNNIFYENNAFPYSNFTCPARGGAIYCRKSNPYIINNTIMQNSSLEGGGIYLENSYPVISNTVFWGNTVRKNNGEGIPNQINDDSGSLEVSHCIVEGGYHGIDNIDKDPIYLIMKRKTGYYDVYSKPEYSIEAHIMDGSPCIDAGDNKAPYLSKLDIEGNDRIHDGDWDKEPIVDIGCDEFAALRVPKDYLFIQDAIENASAGGVVLVAPGTYYGNIKFGPKSVIVASSKGPNQTVIDGQDADSVVAFYSHPGAESYLLGFTITRGHGKGLPDFKGGGITCIDSSPFIDRCIIRGNEAEYAGGGICLRDASEPIIRNCILYENRASTFGGGIALYDSDAEMYHCTLSGNIGWVQGGAVHCDNSVAWIESSIIWDNKSSYLPSISATISHPAVRYSDIEFGYSGIGNIDVDPLFEDPQFGDFHLQPYSPCVDRGHYFDSWFGIDPYLDIDGQMRSEEEFVDMGADEYIKE